MDLLVTRHRSGGPCVRSSRTYPRCWLRRGSAGGVADPPGDDRDAFDIEEAAMVGDPIACPGLADDLEPLAEAITVLGNRNAKGPEVIGHRTPADTELDATVADNIEGRDFLGNAQRMRQRQQYDCDARGAACECARPAPRASATARA